MDSKNFPDQYLYTGFKSDNLTLICLNIPPNVNSRGMVNPPKPPGDFLTYTLPLLELQMGLIFIFTNAIHFMLKPFGASLFISCLLAGVCLGPTFLGRYEFMKNSVFPHEAQDIITTLALLGYNMFLFLGAVKMDVGMVLRAGHKVLSIGVLSVTAPLIFGLTFQNSHGGEFKTEDEFLGSWSVILIHAMTSFPVTAYLIGHQLKISNSELGRLSLSSALVGDLLGISTTITLSLVKTGTWVGVVQNFRPILGFVLVAVFVLRPAMNWIIRKTPERKPVNETYIYIIMALAIGSEAYFNYFHQVQYLGPFIIGLATPAGAPLGSALVEKFEPFTLDVLFQILTATSMMRADLWLVVSEYTKLRKYVTVICVTCSLKLIATLLPALLARMPLIDAMALSVVLNYKGIVELSLSVVYRDLQMISEEVFSLVALSIFLNATILPLLVYSFYDPSRKYAGYQARNIMSLKPNSELKILACVHRPDDVKSIIRLLDASGPSKDHPIGVYVLHLIKLIGRSTPFLISHSKQKVISNSSSKNVIHAFTQYEKNNWGAVSMQFFTAMSMYELMHEDICTLALDKLTSLIIIPLHRKWSIHGNVESEDRYLRTLNCKVLDKAPCSVGIFFDRGRLGRQRIAPSESPTLSLCMLFFGGKDDREALTLAKRMARDSNASLTVVHFTARDMFIASEDRMVDAVLLEDIKQRADDDSNGGIAYIEHAVRDGPETVLIIRAMANDYDVFLLGRRYDIASPQTAGLSLWSELPELGIIGDFFASKDLDIKASVLVVQQQKQIKRLE
ncbi:cation/H(+) antiporter 10 [Ricinus communis]|uniref:Monovalent cation:proton antiporter, putative n=1 Tax=Ricinus communis TaxID=3988 RepID=B9SCK6_RICCO|nr:cation/H(+) antiporter 10 [Ricinus communis]EEF38665.1 monovalent cation:proton antiporter, putative [Ricinus communis]|eukprot:XP_002523725.1 cation/H(+) antiporter 10 [Ricinus communis]